MENNKIIYVDHSATTYVKEEVLNEMLPYFNKNYGNPSSTYSLGRITKNKIEESREKISKIIGCDACEIFFTSGGSEANTMIISGIASKYKNKGKHIITSKIEHKSVLNTCKSLEQKGFKITYLDVDRLGRINITDLENSICSDTILISIMYANNEIGTIQDVEKIAKIAKKHNIFFHTDAVQVVGHIDIDVKKIGVDAMSISAHKFYGPKGVGVAYINKNVEFANLIYGGNQEMSKRAGTENVAGIIGMAKAIEIAKDNINKNREKLLYLRNVFLSNLSPIYDRIIINGDMENRLPGNINMCIKGIDCQTMLLLLDMNGICASSGSACNSSCISPSHVLKAINVPEDLLNNSLRITLGEENTKEEVEFVAKTICNIVLNKIKV